MEWKPTLVAIQISPSDTTVHIIECLAVKSSSRYSMGKTVKTHCGYDINLIEIDEQSKKQEADVNCASCIAGVEKQQAYWREFWRSSKGIDVIKILSGHSRREQKLKEIERDIQALHRSLTELNDLLTSCLKQKEPIFTLELPDETLLKLIDYGSVGEILLAIKMNDDLRKKLKSKLEKPEIQLLGSRLISKGYLKWNDAIFKDW